MLKKSFYKFILVLILCISCYKEEDFVDVTQYGIYTFEVSLFFDTSLPNGMYNCDLIYYHTNGYNETISFLHNYNGSISNNQNSRIITRTVNGYKTIGLKITPEQNIASYQIHLERDFLYPDFFVFHISNPIDEEITIFYNFGTEELTIE